MKKRNKFMPERGYVDDDVALFKIDGGKASIFDICRAWQYYYPSDIFPDNMQKKNKGKEWEVVQIRKLMQEILAVEKKETKDE